MKVCIQVERPTIYVIHGTEYLLPPGKYNATLDKNGILLCKKRGFADGACFIPKAGSFVFVETSKKYVDVKLVKLWEARTALLKAQADYEAAWQDYQKSITS